MQRLRTTFKRSRTPTGADMKTQSSLEVPKQVRSASFDEIQLEAKWSEAGGLLAPPQAAGQRSRSFDSAGGDEAGAGPHLEVPRLFHRRRSGGNRTPPACVHCAHLERWTRQRRADDVLAVATGDRFFGSSDDEDDDEEEEEGDEDEPPDIRLTLPPRSVTSVAPPSSGSPPPALAAPSFELQPPADEPPAGATGRRRSISRQEAFFVEPTGSSLENVSASDASSEAAGVRGVTEVSVAPGLIVRDIYLAVPDLKRDRAASVDSCFSKVSGAKTEELGEREGCLLTVPSGGLRSRSVDIVLPTAEQARYKALALAVPPTPQTPHPPTVIEHGKPTNGTRVLRCTPDWTENAVSGEHLWSPTSVSGDCCYVGDQDCQKHGSRLKCSACKIVSHAACVEALATRAQFACKPTFRDVGVRSYREHATTHHHWVHRRAEKGKCKHCGKSLQAKLSFSSKEIVALSCSWCKDAYHNKEACFNIQRIGEECSLGPQAAIIVPPSWIVKLPRRGSFKSSLRKSPKKKSVSKKKSKESKAEQKTFVIKPIPSPTVKPVLVFINPKSGGNQGAKLLQKFQWLLNPRQVFDLTQGGPGPGLELFRKVPNLRVLACGGDGTVGWVLSVLDRIGARPAVGVLPLGTGNDLARALGWGGGYEDEPISKILAHIGESDTVLLDRWALSVEPNPAAAAPAPGLAKPDLPLSVVNNYFSFGVDAHIALEFHEAREAHPEKFNSRIRNKLFYGTAGGKDLMQRKWKGLAEFVTMECDGKDLTPVLKEHKVHAIVFLNIPSYGGGTHPWNKSGGTVEPSTEDGLIEVVGLTTYQLPLLQAGGHGTCITQCKTAKIVTTKVIPMQVDGEACRLAPSIITLSRLNQATMLAKRKPGRVNAPQATVEQLTLSVNLITMMDYERHHYDKELLAKAAERIGTIDVNPGADLEQVRNLINNLAKESQNYAHLTDWWFVDSCTAERFFRIDRAQENLHYATDIGHENIYILDSAPLTPDTETTAPMESTTSLDNTGPSMSLDTTTGLSVSLDISQSVDTPSAGVSLDVPDQSHNSDSSGPAIIPEESPSPETPVLVPAPVVSEPTEAGPAPIIISSEVPNISQSPPLCTSPTVKEKDTSSMHDSIVRFRRNLLEKTTDGVLKAAKVGDLKMLKDLHNAGYSLLSIDATGQTALHIAARYGNKDIVKYLIACAPSSILNMQDNDKGQTALHKAAAHKRRAVCCMLVAGGANLSCCDNAGHTPRHLALLAEDNDLAAYLESQEHFQLVSEDLETAV